MSTLLAAPWMLLWAFAALIPIALHLLLQRRRREVPWGAMRLVQRAVITQTRPLRLWQLLLLMLRVLAVLCLALALSQPQGCSRQQSVAERSGKLNVLVIDASFSMQAREANGQTRFETAIAQALQRVDEGNDRDGWIVVLMSRNPTSLIGRITHDRSDVKRLLREAVCTNQSADVSATVRLLTTLIEQAEKSDPKLTDREVSWWTDGQQTTWQAVIDQPDRAGLRELADRCALSLVSVAGPQTVTNLAWQETAVRTRLPVANQTFEIEAVLANYGAQPRREGQVSLWVDGIVKQTERIDLSGAGQGRVTFSQRLEAGEHRLTVECENDALAIDNRMHRVVNVRRRLRVAVLGEAQARDLVATAIMPEGNDPAIELVAAEPPRLLESDQAWDVIMLCDVARITEPLAQALRRQVSDGANVFVWIGSRAQADSYNRWLWESPKSTTDADATTSFLPARLESRSTVGSYRIDPLDYQHPLVQIFADYPAAGFTSVPVFRYWHVGQPYAKNAQSVLQVDGGPLVLATDHEDADTGSVVLVTVPADLGATVDEAWSGLPAWPTFVPLVQRMLEWSTTKNIAEPSTVGQPLVGRLNEARESVTVTAPDEAVRQVPTFAVGDATRWRLLKVELPGFYRFNDGEQERVKAVNVDMAESDLTAVDFTKLQALVNTVRPLSDPTTVTPELANDEPNTYREPLFRWALAAMFAALVVEMTFVRWLQRRFG